MLSIAAARSRAAFFNIGRSSLRSVHVVTLDAVENDVMEKPTPLLFVHGEWSGLWGWKTYMDYFRNRGYTVSAMSFRGHVGDDGGTHRMSEKEYNNMVTSGGNISLNNKWGYWDEDKWPTVGMEDLITDMADAARLCGTPPVIIAHGFGGFIAQKYLEGYGAKGAILFSSLPPTPAGVSECVDRILERSTALVDEGQEGGGQEEKQQQQQQQHQQQGGSGMPLSRLVWDSDKGGGVLQPPLLPAAAAATSSTSPHPHTSLLPLQALLDMQASTGITAERVRVPLLVLGGGGDVIVTPAEVEATREFYDLEEEEVRVVGGAAAAAAAAAAGDDAAAAVAARAISSHRTLMTVGSQWEEEEGTGDDGVSMFAGEMEDWLEDNF